MVTLASSMAAQGLARFTANGVQRAASAANAPVSELALGITEFGYRLSEQTASPSKNWVASPLSIAYTFAMARGRLRRDRHGDRPGVRLSTVGDRRGVQCRHQRDGYRSRRVDLSATSTATRELLGWTPTGPTLIEDLDAAAYSAR
jgi:hypothetical protein